MGGNPWDRFFGSKPRSSGGAGADHADEMKEKSAHFEHTEKAIKDVSDWLESYNIEAGDILSNHAVLIRDALEASKWSVPFYGYRASWSQDSCAITVQFATPIHRDETLSAIKSKLWPQEEMPEELAKDIASDIGTKGSS